MKCPTCKEMDLVIADRQGVEIDYCPTCRGVWLDRGELDKLIERAARFEAEAAAPNPTVRTPPPLPQQPPPPQYGYARKPDDSDHGRPYDPHYDARYKKRKSWWTELFD